MIKWTSEIRRALYISLTVCFGPHETWKCFHTPRSSNDAEYKTFLLNFVKYCQDQHDVCLGSKDKDGTQAIQQQINWAITKQVDVNPRFEKTYIQNKSMALETGFLSKLTKACA